MHTFLLVVAAALPSGFLGAWAGAWLNTAHDRRERLKARRIDAADDFVACAGPVMLDIAGAISWYEFGTPDKVDLVEIGRDVDALVTKSARLDLLFIIDSPTCKNADRLLTQFAASVAALPRGDIADAKVQHAGARKSMLWLTLAASDAIRTTGQRSDTFRGLRKLKKEAELDPENRSVSGEEGSDGVQAA